MKKYLIISLLFISSYCKAQDTVHIRRYVTDDGLDSLAIMDSVADASPEKPIKYVFVKVIEDSSDYYHRKFLYFNRKLNKLMACPNYSEKLYQMYRDSCKKYLDLWQNFKK